MIGRAICAWACVAFVTLPALADVDGAAVKQATARGVAALKSAQLPNGGWQSKTYPGGETALATLALLNAGESPSEPRIADAIRNVARQPNQHVYVVSLKIQVLAAVDPKRYREEIEVAARWLVQAQTGSGLWSYMQKANTFDHSNSQFALLGLHAAATADAKFPIAVWQRARTRVLASQNRDGGWSYQGGAASYGSMTAAGVSDLIILGSDVAQQLERGFEGGVAPDCGKYQANRPLLNGLNWLADNFDATQNPGYGKRWTHYWLYAIERCGILTGRRYFGAHDWYREGAARLVKTQNADGAWGDGVIDTALAVLFLAKGHKPLLIQKLQWASDESWNLDRHDVAHLIDFIGDRFGGPIAWQVVPFDAPLEEWLAAPLLYMQGHAFPDWDANQRAKVRAYIEQGGTLLAEACCGRTEFRDGFTRFAAAAFPEFPLRELDAGHPVYASSFEIAPAGLMGIDVGCRTSVFFSPTDLSCLWEQADVPQLSERAFQIGANVAAFATGRQPLRDRLDVVALPQESSAAPTPPPSDALRLGQVTYRGDWRPDPQALVRLSEALRDQAGLNVITRYAAVKMNEDQLATTPIIYMTGHYAFELSDGEISALRGYLRRGGFLLADACCGRPEFDASFRAMVARAFSDAKLEKLDPRGAPFRSLPGLKPEEVRYKPAALAETPGLRGVEVWGLTLDGRLALAYSPYAIGCGVDGHVCYNCRGLENDSARALAVALVLNALSN